VYDAARRFVEDEEGVVFVEDGERTFFRLRPATHVRSTLDLVHPIEHPTRHGNLQQLDEIAHPGA
jgi:hypothetical protein